MEPTPRRAKKSAYIRQVEVLDPSEGHDDLVGEAWAAVTDNGTLISVSTDISVVSNAAFRAGFWLENQE